MKKILTILLFFVSFVHADYLLYVNSPEEVDSMYMVLNGIAKILGSDDYISLLRLAFLFGGALIFFKWVLGTYKDGGKHGAFEFTNYNLVAVALLTLVFSVSTTVWVKSEHFPKYYDSHDSASYTTGVAVDNIPELVGFSFYFLNKFGKKLEDMFEEAVSSTASYSIKDDGYASSLRDSYLLLSNKFSNVDKTLGASMDALISQCILIPFSAKGEDGQLKIEKLFSSSNIKKTLDNWYTNNEIVGGISAKDYHVEYSGNIWKCGDFWDYIKNEKLANYNEKAGKYLSSLDSRDLEMITGLKNVPKSNFDEIAIQSGIVNSIIHNKDLPTGVAYANGKTKSEFVQYGLAAGSYMAEMLPYMQTVLRAIIYALFPLIFVVSLFPGGISVLKNYAVAGLWIELTGVTGVILNYFISKENENRISGDITVYSISKMLDDTSTLAGVAGYLYLSVFMLAGFILKGSFASLQGIGAGMASNIQKNLQTSAVAADSGKMKMKQAASEKAGIDLSFAEALHYQQNFAGMKEGVALGVDINQGEVGVKELADYSAQKPYADFKSKKDALKSLGYSMPTAGLLAGAEGRVSGGSLAKGLGDLDQTGDPKRMYDRGRMGAAGELGKLDEIGVGGTYKVARGSAAKSKGEVDVAGIDGMRGAGRYAGRTDKAHAALEKKHGAALTSAAFFKGNEETIRSNVRGSMLNDGYHTSSEAQRITTEELPNYNKYDFDGDGTVSSSEAARGGQINELGGKMDIAGKKAKQDQLAAEADKNRNSASPAVRNVQSAGESLYNDPNAGAIGAAGVKGGVGTRTDSANTRKDSKVLDQLNDNNTDMEDTAVLDSKRMLGDLAQTKTQTDTTGGLIKDLVQKKSEIREKIADRVNKDSSLSYSQKAEAADKILMQSMAHVGIADGDLTQRNLQRDVQRVQNETQQRLAEGLRKTVGEQDLSTLQGYNTLLQNRENIAQRLETETDPAKKQELQNALKQYDEVVIPNFESSRNMQEVKAKVEAYHSSSEAQTIIKEGQAKLEQTYQSYENMGLIRRDSNGNVQVADTTRTINSLQGEQKALYVEKVKRGLDGLKTSTVGIDGMQLERVNDITGDHITERATATQEWSKTARFNHDIQYYAVSNDMVDPENVAIFNTGVGAVKDMLGMYGFTKVLSSGVGKSTEKVIDRAVEKAADKFLKK